VEVEVVQAASRQAIRLKVSKEQGFIDICLGEFIAENPYERINDLGATNLFL